jgi:hypothetical protein
MHYLARPDTELPSLASAAAQDANEQVLISVDPVFHEVREKEPVGRFYYIAVRLEFSSIRSLYPNIYGIFTGNPYIYILAMWIADLERNYEILSLCQYALKGKLVISFIPSCDHHYAPRAGHSGDFILKCRCTIMRA